MTVLRFNRRRFLAGTALWSVAAGRVVAQSRTIARVGLLAAPAPDNYGHHIDAIRRGLREEGYVDGQNLQLEYRWAEGRYDRLPDMARDLVARKVDVIMTLGGGPPVRAAREATTTVPIVFHLGADPVQAGLVASMNRPGGNVTGVTLMTNVMEPKRLELLLKMVPAARSLGILSNPANPGVHAQVGQIKKICAQAGLTVTVYGASSEDDIRQRFEEAAAQVDALTVLADVVFTSNADVLAELVVKHRLPAIAHSREFAEAGGLMSYGTNLAEAYRLAGGYAGRILKGEKPADLPVLEPTRFDFLINMRTARLLNLTAPPDLLVFADEVIE